MKLLNLKKSAYDYYRHNVRGNLNVSFEQARRKLTRNVLLAVKKKSILNVLKLQQDYIYGCLKITVRNGSIVKLENKTKDAIPGWAVDRNEYIRLSNDLGIYSNKFKWHYNN